MNKGKVRIPQNIIQTISVAGESVVLFYLYTKLKLKESNWIVCKNYSEKGTDILLLKVKNNKNRKAIDKIRIEVKTREKLETITKNTIRVQFNLSKLEKENSDYVVCLWLELHKFLIVPTNEFKPVGKKFRYTVLKKEINEDEYFDNWELIKEKLK